MYHNLSSDVYIQSNNPNIVLVRKKGITWGNFFSTLPIKLTSECLVTGTKEEFCNGGSGRLNLYINGKIDNSVLGHEIKDGDSLLVTFGNESKDEIRNQIDKIPRQ